jgi:hypothetical protein
MPDINATVYWDTTTKGPLVNPDPINVESGTGATVIQWTCGTGVTNFQITGLSTTEFTYSANQNPVTVFTATDKNDTVGTFTYNVTATHSSGITATHDPKIENGSEMREKSQGAGA